MNEIPVRLSAALAERYRLERVLGAGGMATVYLAEDLKHHRKVAVKVLRPELAAVLGPERFLREIDTTAKLRHPHILPLYDSGEAGGYLYYVMPLVEGESLRDRLSREKQLPVASALEITREMADALGYAHAHGVVHRDIKPENILLESGHAVVADFGIARAVVDAGGEKLTETGIVIGTPTYMSPEQAAGDRDIDGRSDQYSLGCVLYEMLAGQPPFTGPTVQSIVHQHISAEPKVITQIRPSVPGEVATALTRALSKTPADRFDSLSHLIEVMGRSGPAMTVRVASGKRRALLAAVGAIVMLVGFLVWLNGGTPKTIQFGRRIQVTLDPGLELDPALSPDGKFLAYSGPGGELMVRQIENGSPLRVVRDGDTRGRWPAWVPDGERLIFISSRGIEIVPALGGVPRLLVADSGLGRGASVAPDGKSLVYASHDSLYARPLDGGAARLVTVGREVHSFTWSPDGRWIAFVSGNIQYVRLVDVGNLAVSSVWIAPVNGGPPVQISDSQSQNVSPAWVDGRSLLYLSNRDGGRDVYQVDLTSSGRPAHPPTRLTTGLNALAISVSLRGQRLAYSSFSEASNVWSIPIPASGSVSISEATPVTVGNQTIENFDVSSDGHWVAFSSDRNGVTQVYRQRVDGKNTEPQQLTADTVGSYWSAWSPDGKEIAFHRFRGERRMDFVIAAEGGTPVQVTDGREDERSPEWSPDGRHLILLANWGTRPELHLYTRNSAGQWSGPRRVPVVLGTDTIAAGLATWSPDGRFLACGCGSGGIVIIPLDGAPARRLASPFSTSGWALPQWSADGRTVFHVTEDSGRVMSAIAVPLDGGAPRVIVRFNDPARPWHRYGFRVRASRIFVTLGDEQSDIWETALSRR
ncbi:MAG: protein kinase [Gemmatimonadota bacterium]